MGTKQLQSATNRRHTGRNGDCPRRRQLSRSARRTPSTCRHRLPSTLFETSVLAKLSAASADFDSFCRTLNESGISTLFQALASELPAVKYGCMRVLRRIAEKRPDLIYPSFQRIARLLDSADVFLQWGAIIIIGSVAEVDNQHKIDSILERYLKPITGPVMITAANTVGGAGRVARAKPHLADRIARAFLQIEDAMYRTPECRNIALGHAIKSLDLFFEHLREPTPMIEFVRRQLKNPRHATHVKAVRFLKKHAPPGSQSR